MDDADRAADLEERQREQAKLLRKPEPPDLGFCNFCNTPLKFGKFCSPECAADWQLAYEARIRNGGR